MRRFSFAPILVALCAISNAACSHTSASAPADPPTTDGERLDLEGFVAAYEGERGFDMNAVPIDAFDPVDVYPKLEEADRKRLLDRAAMIADPALSWDGVCPYSGLSEIDIVHAWRSKRETVEDRVEEYKRRHNYEIGDHAAIACERSVRRAFAAIEPNETRYGLWFGLEIYADLWGAGNVSEQQAAETAFRVHLATLDLPQPYPHIELSDAELIEHKIDTNRRLDYREWRRGQILKYIITEDILETAPSFSK